MVIKVFDHVRQCYSADDGAVIGRILREAFGKGDKVVLSFAGISDVTSSFVNASIVAQLDAYSADWVKSHLSVKDISVSAADVVRRCLANGERNRRAA